MGGGGGGFCVACFQAGTLLASNQTTKACGVTLRFGVERRTGGIDSLPPVIAASCRPSLHRSTMSKDFLCGGGGGVEEAMKEGVEGKLDGGGALETFQGE